MHEKETYLSAVSLVIWVCRGAGDAVTLHDRRRGMTQQGLHGAHPRQGHMLQHRVAVLFSISIHYQEIRNGCYWTKKLPDNKRALSQKSLFGLLTNWSGILWIAFVGEISWPEMWSIAENYIKMES